MIVFHISTLQARQRCNCVYMIVHESDISLCGPNGVVFFQNNAKSWEFYLITHGAEPFWRSRTFCRTQEFPSILWNPKVHHRFYNSPPLYCPPTYAFVFPVVSFLLDFPPISYTQHQSACTGSHGLSACEFHIFPSTLKKDAKHPSETSVNTTSHKTAFFIVSAVAG